MNSPPDWCLVFAFTPFNHPQDRLGAAKKWSTSPWHSGSLLGPSGPLTSSITSSLCLFCSGYQLKVAQPSLTCLLQILSYVLQNSPPVDWPHSRQSHFIRLSSVNSYLWAFAIKWCRSMPKNVRYSQGTTFSKSAFSGVGGMGEFSCNASINAVMGHT